MNRHIPFEAETQLPVLRAVLALQPIDVNFDQQTRQVYFSGLTAEILAYVVYPVVLSACKGKHTSVVGSCSFILGTSHPKYVFMALEEAFKMLWPDVDVNMYLEDWELVKYNKNLYGLDVFRNRPKKEVVDLHLCAQRNFGGTENETGVLWAREIKYKRAQSAVKVEEFLSNAFPFSLIEESVQQSKKLNECMLLEGWEEEYVNEAVEKKIKKQLKPYLLNHCLQCFQRRFLFEEYLLV